MILGGEFPIIVDFDRLTSIGGGKNGGGIGWIPNCEVFSEREGARVFILGRGAARYILERHIPVNVVGVGVSIHWGGVGYESVVFLAESVVRSKFVNSGFFLWCGIQEADMAEMSAERNTTSS